MSAKGAPVYQSLVCQQEDGMSDQGSLGIVFPQRGKCDVLMTTLIGLTLLGSPRCAIVRPD